MATRIYEIAKKYDKSSKDIIALLKNHGFEYQSHMAVLGPKELTIIERVMRGVEKKTKKTEHTPSKKIKQEKDTFRDESPKQNIAYAQNIIKESSKKDSVIVSAPEAKAVEIIVRPMTVHKLSEVLNKPISDILMTLLRWGIMSAKNEVLEADTVHRLAEQYGAIVIKPTVIEKEFSAPKVEQQQNESLVERLPVIVVLGHVDHGKTTLLDFIRKTRVAEKEKGGITQHIGAYEVSTLKGNLIFIDTPGHEAFTKIRHRGSRVADLAILVIAGDDGMMPQTIEAIKHIKAAQLPVVVAINKMDKADPARLDIIKRQLAQQDLLPEDWGGQIVCVPISAKTGLGVDNLLEMVALQAQLLELRANAHDLGKAYVLESKIDKGRGAIATIIGYYGTIKIGDYFICGKVTGHITSLINSYGILLSHVGPSIPVSVAGFDALAEVGDYFAVVSKEEYRQARARNQNIATATTQRAGQADAVNIIIKTDTNSSREALLESIEKIARTSPVGIHIVLSGVGLVNESDVELAYNTGAHIIVFNIKPETKAMLLAQQRGVSISQFSVIYTLLEYLTAYVESKRVQEMVSKKIGEAEVLRVFDIKGVGTIAGCRVTEGKFSKDGSVAVWREGYKIGSGKIASLQREKRTVKEVAAGFECGFMIEGFTDFIVGDRVECFIQVPATPR
ncbi:MAG TPA: translation initiation factor IF-2 [Candidatus Babeliales bacterium]|jgi:translation initiation factor IF-2|nr:translation initiation factor IF-2 [Candidatus Babeliales bacterium]